MNKGIWLTVDKMTYRDILQRIYSDRKQRNPQYSLSAYSRDAGFKSYHMSDILSSRYGLSTKRSVEVASALNLSGVLREKFLLLVAVEHARSPKDKEEAQKRLEDLEYDPDLFIKESGFKLINKWYDTAIIVLANEESVKIDKESVAKTLNISLDEAAESLSNLRAIGVLAEGGSGRVNEHKLASVVSEGESEAIQFYHKQNLLKAVDSLNEVPVTERSFLSYTSVLTDCQYKNLAELVDDTVRKALLEMQDEKKKFKVEESLKLYTFSSQLFPLGEIEV